MRPDPPLRRDRPPIVRAAVAQADNAMYSRRPDSPGEIAEWSIVALTSREPIARTINAVLTLMFGLAAVFVVMSGQLPDRIVPVAIVVAASTVVIAAAWRFGGRWPSRRFSIANVVYSDVALATVLVPIESSALSLPLCGGFAIIALFVVVGASTPVFIAHAAFSAVVVVVIGVTAVVNGDNGWVVLCAMLVATGGFAGPFVLTAYIRHLRLWAHRALHDPLTGVLNARGLSEALDHANSVSRATGRTDSRSIGVTVVDIDRFSALNDRLGHRHGDAALTAVAARLVDAVTADTIVARLGADQFVAVHVGTADTVGSTERRIAAAMDEVFTEPVFTTSVGSAGPVEVVAGDRPGGMVRRLLAVADIELWRRKATNGADTRFRPPREPLLDSSAVRRRIRTAIAEGALTPVFQPICGTDTGSTVGYEALTRFPPGHGSPLMWFRDATEAGIGAELESACIAAALTAADSLPAGVYLSLNVSATTLLTTDLATVLHAQAGARQCCIEITEHDRFDDYRAIAAAVAELRGSGVKVAVDDVGSGFASLRLVVECQPDVVKVDYELTRGIDADPLRRAGVAALVMFSHSIGATVIMEGVETEAELAVAVDLGADMVQGFLTGRPVPAHEVTATR